MTDATGHGPKSEVMYKARQAFCLVDLFLLIS